MTTVETSIDVDMPVRSVYNQWTQFEDFPYFMEGVESVTQDSDSMLHWCANIGGIRREWDAQIVEQVPDKLLAWRSVDGTQNAGAVMFDKLDEGRTRVLLRLEHDAKGLAEKAADTLGIVERRVEGDLQRFKDFLEARGAETGEWRGEIEQGRTVKLDQEERKLDLNTNDLHTEESEYPVMPPP